MKKLFRGGIGVRNILLAIIVISVVGSAGYYLYSKNSSSVGNDNNPQNSSENENVNPYNPDNITNLPADWVRYENGEVGFSFYYPPEWNQPRNDYENDTFTLYFGSGAYTEDKLVIRAIGEGLDPSVAGEPWTTNQQGYQKQGNQYFSNYGDGSTVRIDDYANFKVLDNEAVLWTTPNTFAGQVLLLGSFNVDQNPFTGIGLMKVIEGETEPTKKQLEEFQLLLSTLRKTQEEN